MKTTKNDPKISQEQALLMWDVLIHLAAFLDEDSEKDRQNDKGLQFEYEMELGRMRTLLHSIERQSKNPKWWPTHATNIFDMSTPVTAPAWAAVNTWSRIKNRLDGNERERWMEQMNASMNRLADVLKTIRVQEDGRTQDGTE